MDIKPRRSHPRRPLPVTPPPRGTAPTPPNPPVTRTHESVPPRRPKFFTRLQQLLFSKWGIACLLVVACLVVFLWTRSTSTNHSVITNQTPEYKTVLPEGKNIGKLGGWKRISPPENDPVFAYSDHLDNVPISVSQQPLPETFKNDAANKVAEVAQKFNATDKLDIEDTTAYIGTSSKGPQSVIFTKNNLLIMIKSEKKINGASWISYIKQLG